MKSGYENHFKKMKNKSTSSVMPKVQKRRGHVPFPIISVFVALVGAGLASYGYTHLDFLEGLLGEVEVTLLGAAKAASGGGNESSASAANSSGSKDAGAANVADSTKESLPKGCTEQKGFTQEELSHFNKLNDRKKELDLRDAELNQLEEELHKQKKEIEERIVKLDQIRNEVANVLKERVEIDQARVTTLVDFYSNMKPKQAADIFTKLNENLAVEVLSKMKKKNAAEILNLLEPGKARALSEKFTGYQRQ